MSPITSYLIQQLAYSSPSLLVYLAGAILGAIFIKKYRTPAMLTLFASLILLITTVGVSSLQAYLLSARVEYGWSAARHSQMLTLVSLAGNIIRAVCLGLWLAAVFVGRKSKTVTQS